jgi:hypothetical protein
VALGDDERTNAVGLFNTARSYWRSAEHLEAAQLKVTHPGAPGTFLFCHAIELYLKAYLRNVGRTVEELRQVGHRVARLADAASKSGLPIGREQAEVLSHIDDAGVAIEARYIVTGFKTLPTNEALSDVASALDQTIGAVLRKSGLPVRDEEFTAPETPPHPGELSQETIGVLVHIFNTPEIEGRGVTVMALVLQHRVNTL